MCKSIILGFAVFTLASGTLSALPTSVAAAPFDAVKKACDDMNKQKSGSCKMAPFSRQVMAGCAGNVCFECPIDGKRMCFAAPGKGGTFTVLGNDGKPLNVSVSSSGTFVEAVLKGCDTFAEQKRGTCMYDTVARTGTAGSTDNVSFECPDNKECRALAGKSGKIGSTTISP
jgi:hypothetical protein